MGLPWCPLLEQAQRRSGCGSGPAVLLAGAESQGLEEAPGPAHLGQKDTEVKGKSQWNLLLSP